MLICFMALMMGKYLEINTSKSLRQIRKELWQVHETHIRDEQTGEVHVMQMDTAEFAGNDLQQTLEFRVFALTGTTQDETLQM